MIQTEACEQTGQFYAAYPGTVERKQLTDILEANQSDTTSTENLIFLPQATSHEALFSSLDDSARQSDMHIIMRDTLFSQSVLTLMTGIFITGFALSLGASNAVVGLLLAIPALAQLAQLPTAALLEKTRALKTFIIRTTLLSRLLIIPFAIIPFWSHQSWALPAMILMFTLYSISAAVALCAWNVWVKETIRPEELGGFFSAKLALGSLITILLTLGGGMFIDCGKPFCSTIQAPVYSLLFLFAAMLGVYGVFPLRKIRALSSPRLPKPAKENELRGQKLLRPFKHVNFKKLLTFLGVYDFAINLAIPFFSIHMLTALHYPMALVTGITIVQQIANCLSLKVWGKVADRWSNKTVLMVAGPLQLFSIAAWAGTALALANHAGLFWMIIAVQVVLGIASAGVALANGNIAMKLAPHEQSSSYMASSNMVAALASGSAPLVTGWLTHDIKHTSALLGLLPNGLWYALFSLACILGGLAIFHLRSIEEKGYATFKLNLARTLSIRRLYSSTFMRSPVLIKK